MAGALHLARRAHHWPTTRPVHLVRLRSPSRGKRAAALDPPSLRLTGGRVRVTHCDSGAGSPFLLALCGGLVRSPRSVRGRRLSVYGRPHEATKEGPTVEARPRLDRQSRASHCERSAGRRGGRGRRRVARLAATVDGEGARARRHARTVARRGGRPGARRSRLEDARHDLARRAPAMEGRRGVAQALELQPLRARPDRVHRLGSTAGRHRKATRGVRA